MQNPLGNGSLKGTLLTVTLGVACSVGGYFIRGNDARIEKVEKSQAVTDARSLESEKDIAVVRERLDARLKSIDDNIREIKDTLNREILRNLK